MSDNRQLTKTKHPGIFTRGEGQGKRYVVVYRVEGKQRRKSLRTYAEARRFKDTARADQARGEYFDPSRVLFRDYAATWVEAYRGRTQRGFSETTRIEYRRDVKANLIPFFGSARLSAIHPRDVNDWFGWMEQRGASASAIRKARAALSALYATAKQNGEVRDNPVSGIRYVPSVPLAAPRKLRPLTLAELERFMAALPPGWDLFFLMLAHTGVRISELLGLDWKRVHLGDDPSVAIVEQVYHGQRKRLKSKHAERRIPLSCGMAAALTSWRGRTPFPEDGSPLFPSSVGTPMSYANVYNRILVPARTAAGIPGEEVGAFHAFRRTLGSLMHASKEKSDRQLSDWLGHHDPAFSVREYVGTMDEGLGSADFLDELIPLERTTPGQPPRQRSGEVWV